MLLLELTWGLQNWKKANQLKIEIITEHQFRDMING